MEIIDRAAQIWPVLMFAAYHRQTIDYRYLSRLIGVYPTQRQSARNAVFHHTWLDETAPAPADFAPFSAHG